MNDRMSLDDVTPEMAKQELARRMSARAELHNSQFASKHPIVEGVLGAGDALRDMMSLGLLSGQKSGEGTAYNVGNVAGNVAGFVGGGEALEAAPLIGKIASYMGNKGIGGVTKRMAGGAAYGAAVNPEDRVKGALYGAGGSAVADAIPFVGGNLIGAFQPQKHAENILEVLGRGSSLEQNGKELAKSIKSAYNTAKEKGSGMYDAILEHSGLGDNSIYREVNPSGYYGYLDKPALDVPSPTGDLKQFYDAFEKNPTLKNAHALQSQLRTEALSIKPIDIGSKLMKRSYLKSRNDLKSHIYDYLESESKGLGDEYEATGEKYANTVGHYLDNKKIRDIAMAKTVNPKNLGSVFRNPQPGIEKIADDLGEEGKNRILYATLGQSKGKVTGESLLNAMADLDKKGLSSYVTPHTGSLMRALEGKIRNRNMLQRAGGFIAGSQIGKAIGVPGGQAAGAVLGAMETPNIMRTIQPKLPNTQMSGNLTNMLSNTYKYGSKAALANFLK